MKRRALLGHLQEHGCVVVREGGSHSIWSNPKTGRKEAVPRMKSKSFWHVPFAEIFPFQFRPVIDVKSLANPKFLKNFVAWNHLAVKLRVRF